PSGPPCTSSDRNATPTTTVGSTNGTVTSARTTRRPGNRHRYSTYAPGTPSSTENAVPSTACHSVSPRIRHVRGWEKTSANPDRSSPPSSPTNPRATSVTTGHAKNTPRNTNGTAAARPHRAARPTPPRRTARSLTTALPRPTRALPRGGEPWSFATRGSVDDRRRPCLDPLVTVRRDVGGGDLEGLVGERGELGPAVGERDG